MAYLEADDAAVVDDDDYCNLGI